VSKPSFVKSNGAPTERTPLLDTDDDSASPASAAKLIGHMAGQKRSEEAIASRKVLYFGSGSGISEVKCILSGFVIHGYLGFWTLFTKSVGLALSVASGLSLGKEGPFVHIASCVGNIVCRLFSKYERNESKRREILSCACAAGVSVAFGAPVGGVLFSLEEVSYYFPAKVMFRSFFCAMVAAATLRALDPFGTGKIVLFQVTYDRDWHWIELFFFVIIGVFGGLFGAAFTRLNVLWSTRVRAKTWMARHPVYEVAMITIISVAFTFLNGYTRMSGPELIADLFGECHEHESLDGLCVSKASEIGPLLQAILFAMISKGLLTVVTFGIKLPAGIFIPTLAVGACFGRIVGLLVQYAQWTRPDSVVFQWCPVGNSSCIVPGVYAMVGAAASLSGVTRTTVSLVVIMFELTGTLTYAVPVMLSVLVARTVADALEHKGIYDLVLQFSGLPYLDAKEEHTWQDVSILDAVDTGVDLIVLDQENTVDSLRQKLQRLSLGLGYTDGGFPLVIRQSTTVKKWKLVGYIAAQELEHGLNRLMLSDPGADPSQLLCTFRHVSLGHTSDEADGTMRDSLFLSMEEPSDLSVYVDKAPLTITTSSPLELVHQMFVKLGVRYLVVLNTDGSFRGLIFKKRCVSNPLEVYIQTNSFLPGGSPFSHRLKTRCSTITSALYSYLNIPYHLGLQPCKDVQSLFLNCYKTMHAILWQDVYWYR
jgi:chloride channel 3/4/5